MSAWRVLLVLASLLPLAACEKAPKTGLDFPEGFPERLSEWHLLQRESGLLELNDRVVPYDLISPLFSDYAHKLRTVLVPQGTQIAADGDMLRLPVGSVITKTFYYPRAQQAGREGRIAVRKDVRPGQGRSLDLEAVRLVETRLLVHTQSGWVALPYVWNEEQSDAVLSLAGEVLALELVDGKSTGQSFSYLVPDSNQCAGCHALDHQSKKIEPIGLRVRHLHRTYDYAPAGGAPDIAHQFDRWEAQGLITGADALQRLPHNAQWDEPGNADVEQRARAYLDANCGHCHSDHGPANTSGLVLTADERDPVRLGVCKTPVASGRGSGDALYDIVPGAPEASILLHRMNSVEPDVAMPELGRSLIHTEGVELIREWIAQSSGACPQKS